MLCSRTSIVYHNLLMVLPHGSICTKLAWWTIIICRYIIVISICQPSNNNDLHKKHQAQALGHPHAAQNLKSLGVAQDDWQGEKHLLFFLLSNKTDDIYEIVGITRSYLHLFTFSLMFCLIMRHSDAYMAWFFIVTTGYQRNGCLPSYPLDVHKWQMGPNSLVHLADMIADLEP